MMAMAGMPNWAQAPASSSGTAAPSRKLKAERACSSTYPSVIAAFHEPAARAAVEAVKNAVGEGHVPFVAGPGVGSPPVARSAPRPGQFQDFPANAIGRHEAGMSRSQRHTGKSRWAKHPQGEAVAHALMRNASPLM